MDVIRYPYISCLCKFGTAIPTSSINFIQLFFILVILAMWTITINFNLCVRDLVGLQFLNQFHQKRVVDSMHTYTHKETLRLAECADSKPQKSIHESHKYIR